MQYPDDQFVTDEWLQKKAILANDFFAIHRLPAGYNGSLILLQASRIAVSIREWLDLPPPVIPVKILIFSAKEPLGSRFLEQSRTRHQATGYYDPGKQVLVVVGEVDDPRFWTVLNHEISHAVLYSCMPGNIGLPFWFNEGVATLFEGGVENLQPRINNERLEYMRYHIDKKRPLDIQGLILLSGSSLDNSSSTYARAWAVTAYLYFCGLPVSTYVKDFPKKGASEIVRFEKSFLLPHETLDEFSTSCIQWIVSQTQ
ncbi:DUF1570 domain-containing protein [Desulfocapsa sulfexigens]|uniref:DUF1570 domain-containing protein n=1 Tax=Desulfocapsa sulfexigens TaxID=65555 RepID=UPI0005A533DE|nr:DUF1570 domain-containing protein [Desulfocapsa sulfexigens]